MAATPTQRRTAAGWTASTISHNQQLQDAAHVSLAPTPQQKNLVTDLMGKVLGYRNTGVDNAKVVGTASTSQNAGIPATIQAATQNLLANSQSYQLSKVMEKFMQAVGGNKQPTIVNTTSPEMEKYYANKNAIMEQPAQIATNIAAVSAQQDKLQPTGIMSITPGVPGSYEGSVSQQLNQQLVGLYGQATQAQQAARSTGWTPAKQTTLPTNSAWMPYMPMI